MLRTGGEIVVDTLINAGVEYIIGIPGHGCLALTDAIRDRVEKGLIKYLQVKQEMSAVHMADGYFRATGKPLAVFTSIGAGALNTAIGLATSFVDSTALLAIIGDTHLNMKGSGVLQEVEKKYDSDLISCFKPITKRCWPVESIVQLPRIMNRAFKQMLEGRKGPVLISIPMDVQAEALDVESEQLRPKTFAYKIPGDPESIQSAYALMTNAKRPVILAGGGVLYSDAHEELRIFAEKWGAAVVTTMAGKSCFPEDHPLYGWHGGSKGTDVGNHLCRSADVLLAVGCRFADETTSSYRKGVTYDFTKTKLIHVDLDWAEIGKNYTPEIGIIADAKSALKQFIQKFDESGVQKDYQTTDYFKEIQAEKAKWFEKLKVIRNDGGDRLTISKVLEKINQVFPDYGIIVTSSGNTQAQILQEYAFRKPKTLITTGGFSTMGFAYPAALGVKLANLQKPVLAITGDGDFMMTMQEMATAVQYDIPVIAMILNNYGWMAIKDLQIDVYGSGYAFGNDFINSQSQPYSPDFAAAAQSFGMEAVRVATLEGMEKALTGALETKKPLLIEVMVDNQYPYSGGKAFGWWDVPIPGYMGNLREDYVNNRQEEERF
jgi:acetolactate synthase-1/2/3 large subunit